jgi:anaerobic dimethyl sulfoxide reductase subunit A
MYRSIQKSNRKSRNLSEKKKDETVAEKKISRRSMLKWTGALAGAAVIGGAVVYGATYKPGAPPPAPPPSFKPPLSPEVQTAVDGIVKDLIDMHAGETAHYGACSTNCASKTCLFKWKVKNGVLTAIEPDDTNHPNVPREDSVMSQQEFDWGQFQTRGCPIGWSFVDHLNSPDRVLYPLKRAGERGENKWTRISYDEAMNEITNNMIQLKAKYGPFFLLCTYSGTAGFDKVGPSWGAGTMGYGLCSDDVGRITGPFCGLTGFSFSVSPSNDSADSLKYSKLVIALGLTHFTTHYGGRGFASGWYKRLTREKGVPLIYIDPKYTQDAEVWADQWIPIKPGTDTALLMAMAYVILSEGLYDKAWTDQYMYGFQEQADYILGKGGKGVGDFDPTYVQYDTIPKTPEWAEQICAVPADTIRALARLYAKSKPAVLIRHYSVTRKSYGEYGLKMAMYLAVITGNGPGVQGGFCSNGTDVRPTQTMITEGRLPAGTKTEERSGMLYTIPTFYRAFHWWKAVEYGTNVLNGGPSVMNPGQKMTWDEWGILVGFNAAPQFITMFNPRMIWGSNNDPMVMGENTNAQIRAETNPNIEFSFYQHTRITTTGKYRDIILPITDPMFEESGWATSNYGGFTGNNFLAITQNPPGEAKPVDQNCCHLLDMLGKAEGRADLTKGYWSGYNGDATFMQDYIAAKAAGWEKNGRAWLASQGVPNPPTYDDLLKGAVGDGVTHIHVEQFTPEIDTYAGQPVFQTKIDTRTGKYEHFWDAVADPSTRGQEHFDYKKRKYAHLPNNWKDLQPISVYRPCYRGMEDFPSGALKNYPLMLLTSNTKYGIHYFMKDPGNPRTLQCWRHSVHISATDAKARGIRDNDLVRVYNEKGQSLMPAYVTNRLMPGVVQVRTGMPPKFSSGVGGRPDVMDMRGCANIFTGGDDVSPVTPAKVTSSVQVEKYADGKVY